MKTIPLYRYNRPGGGVTVSTVKPNAEYTELTRLVADEGYILTDGTEYTTCIDMDYPAAWVEVVDIGEADSNPDEATEADYQNALRDLGVDV